MSLYELFSAWASGKMSEAPIYNKNPAKNPRYKIKKYGGTVKNKVAMAPRTGAMATKNKNAFDFLSLFLWDNIRVIVFIPSVKSCDMTAIAINIPIVELT